MPTLPPPPASLPPRASANERFRAAGRSRARWSIVLSVALHLLVVAAWPAFDLPVPRMGGGHGSEALYLLGLGSPSPDPEVSGNPAHPMPGEEPDAPSEEAPEDAGSPDPGDDGTGARVLQGEDVLGRLAALHPSLAPPTPLESRSLADGAPTEGRDRAGPGFRLRGTDAGLEYDRLTPEELLELERLSALRPDLAFSLASRWPLIRNPGEVADFLAKRFGTRMQGHPVRAMAVSLWIDERGSVEWAEITRSSGEEELDRSALELFRVVAAFRPALEQGMRVPVAALFWIPLP